MINTALLLRSAGLC
uniref:Uncharacterized protein n=1 Tax=Anguilla anguilla TaxID=7936 RepID=A0A0E9PUS5_ANGAN